MTKDQRPMTDHPCKGLTKAQREAFEQIAVNLPHRATHKTLLALRAKGLIGYTDKVIGRDALGKITVPEWFVPLPVHMQWCQWCSEQPEIQESVRP
jgi:hypothetical protein